MNRQPFRATLYKDKKSGRTGFRIPPEGLNQFMTTWKTVTLRLQFAGGKEVKVNCPDPESFRSGCPHLNNTKTHEHLKNMRLVTSFLFTLVEPRVFDVSLAKPSFA